MMNGAILIALGLLVRLAPRRALFALGIGIYIYIALRMGYDAVQSLDRASDEERQKSSVS